MNKYFRFYCLALAVLSVQPVFALNNIDTGKLQLLMKSNPDLHLIDVRTWDEIRIAGGHIAGKNHFVIPRGWLELRMDNLVPDKMSPIVVYSGTNQRSPLAANLLTKMGYTSVRNYAEGFNSWRDAGLPVDQNDQAPNSILFRYPQEVVPGVWSAIGETWPGTYENSGHNNNLSFIVTNEGVLVVNAGDNYLLAKALHEEIKKITDKPVRYVVLENGQGHAVLGSSYWQEQGAIVVAHKEAAKEIEDNAFGLLERMQAAVRDKAIGTRVVMPDKTFEGKMVIELGGVRFELIDLGPSHSPGDIVVWLPQKQLVISGDMAFHERLLPVFEHTDTGAWIKTWDKFAALGAKVVIPGHGGPTDMATVTKYTRDYLVYMRERIAKVIDAGGDVQAAYEIDQSAYEHLATFDFLAKQNAGRIFRAMEFE